MSIVQFGLGLLLIALAVLTVTVAYAINRVAESFVYVLTSDELTNLLQNLGFRAYYQGATMAHHAGILNTGDDPDDE